MSQKLLGISIVLFGLLFTFSCKKYKPDTLEGDLSYLVGTWDWDSTFHRINGCTGSGMVTEETIFPLDNQFSLLFEEEGYVSFFANDSLLRREGIRVDFFNKNESNINNVSLSLGGNMNDVISASGTEETNIFLRFPFESNDTGCEDHLNYFSKR